MNPIVYGFTVALVTVSLIAIIFLLFGVHFYNKSENLYIQIQIRDELIERQNNIIDEYRKGQR